MKEITKLLQEVEKLNENEEYNKVIEILTNEILEKYKNANLYAESAMAFWNTKRYDECKIAANKTLELDNKNVKAYKYLGALSNNLKEYEKAKEYYLKAIEIDPKYSSPYHGLGNVYSNLKEYEKAKEYYLKAIEIDPKFSYSYHGLGNVCLNLKEYEKAKEYYLKAIEIDPKFSYSYHGLGKVYSDLNEYEKAIEYYLKAIEIDPKYSSPYNGLGRVYIYLREYQKAKECFLKAIEIDPKDSYPYNELGRVHFYLREYQKAKEYYLKIIEIDTKDPAHYLNLGIVYSKLKEYQKAKEYYLKAIKIDPKDPAHYFNLGSVYSKLKEYEKAKETYKKFLELDMYKGNLFFKIVLSRINEIEKIQENSTYKKVNNIIDKIKDLLKYKEDCVTHYTGISTVQFLILKESPLRLSEGSFLNDTSEGQELFSFLDYYTGDNVSKKSNKELFTRRPFIGSFVDAEKNNNLTLWRMYGKEMLEEAKGCSISLNANDLISKIKEKICPGKDFTSSSFDDIQFYRVAYRNDANFEFAGASDIQKKELSKLMKELFEIIEEFKKEKKKKKGDEKEVIELLNQIAYLFKSTEYKYENEIRLIIKDGIGFDKKINFDNMNFTPSITPLKVFIELVPIHNLLNKITIGPKVDKAEEWASTFYYQLANNNLYPEIEISTLPFK